MEKEHCFSSRARRQLARTGPQKAWALSLLLLRAAHLSCLTQLLWSKDINIGGL